MVTKRAKQQPRAISRQMTLVARITPEALQRMTCPRCKNVSWHRYRLIPDAPAAGCGRCGYVVYLTAPLGPTYVTTL